MQQLDLDKDLCLYTLHIGRDILHKETPLPSVIINLLLAYCSIYELEPLPFPGGMAKTYNDQEFHHLIHPQARVTSIRMPPSFGKTRMLIKFCLSKEIECKSQGIPITPKILFYSKDPYTRFRLWHGFRMEYNWMMKDDEGPTKYTAIVIFKDHKDLITEQPIAYRDDILVIDDVDLIHGDLTFAQFFDQVIVTHTNNNFNLMSCMRLGEQCNAIRKDLNINNLPPWLNFVKPLSTQPIQYF